MVRKFSLVLIVALILIGAPVLFAGGAAEEAAVEGELPRVQLQLAHSSNPGGAAGAAAFRDYVAEASDGRMTVNLIDYQALGSAREVADQIRLGELEITALATAGLTHIWPDLQMVNVPFIFTDREVFWEVMKDDEYVSYIRDNVLAASRNTLRYLGAAENSVRHLYVNEEIRVPQDLSDYGIQIRVQESPIMQAVWTGLGAGEVVAMSGGERDAAVQAGTLDAIEGSFGGAWRGGNLSVLGHAVLTGHVYDYMHYFMNNEFYESLPAEYQQIIDDAIIVAIDAHNQAALESERESIVEAEDAGVWVYQPTAAELQQWQDRAIPAGEQFVQGQVAETFQQLTLETIERITRMLNN